MPFIFIFFFAVFFIAFFALAWRLRRRSEPRTRPADDSTPLTFRLHFIALPLAILAISVIAAIISYPRLPDPVAYHFRFDGSPDRWLSRTVVILLMVVPQVIFTAIAAGIPLGVVLLVSLKAPFRPSVRINRLVAVMGNMMALPQALLGFTMLDIVSYNSFGVHLMPLWVFALVLVGGGIITLGWFFKSAIRSRK